MVQSELSECTSHLVEYAANRGLSRIPQMTRIRGTGNELPYYEQEARDSEVAPAYAQVSSLSTKVTARGACLLLLIMGLDIFA